MRIPFLAAALALFAVGCGGDADDDGLKNGEEKKLGTDPKNPDTDGDGIRDSDEVNDTNTDPLKADADGDGLNDSGEVLAGTASDNADTDGDGYWDGDEVAAGSDPLDATEGIFAGGWPYNRNKDAMNDPGLNGSAEEGTQFADIVGIDQFGDEVHLYDFAHQGKMVMVDFSAEWCGPCNDLAEYLATGKGSGWNYEATRAAIEAGDLYWITVVTEDTSGQQADGDTSRRWYDDHTDDYVPVFGLTLPKDDVYSYLDLVYFPTTILLDENMMVMTYENDPNPYAAADECEDSL